MSDPYPTSHGSVLFVVCSVGPTCTSKPSVSSPRQVAYVYVQAPFSPGFINPISAWSELVNLGVSGPLQSAVYYVLLIAIVPVGVLFGLLASRRLVRRSRPTSAGCCCT